MQAHECENRAEPNGARLLMCALPPAMQLAGQHTQRTYGDITYQISGDKHTNAKIAQSQMARGC